MARSELIRDFEALMNKIRAQKDIFIKKIESVDYEKAALDDSIYESFMPTVLLFQDELDKMQTIIFDELHDMCMKLITMYDEIDKVSPGPDVDESDDGDEEVDDEEFSKEDIERYEREADEHVKEDEDNKKEAEEQ